MLVSEVSLLEFLGEPGVRLEVPRYQRAYSWKAEQCEELWRDLFRAVRARRSHFTGALMYVEEEGRRAIVDGQQRLTTLTLIIAAMAARMRDRGESLFGSGPDDLQRDYLLAGDGPKLELSHADRDSLAALVSGKPPAPDASARVRENYGLIAGLVSADDLEIGALWQGLSALSAIVIRLERPDKAPEVFENLNSKGVALVTADLVRAGQTGESHFMGMLLFVADPDAREGLTQLDVIDGQQRMTTLTLLLSAVYPGEFALAPLALSEQDRDTLRPLTCGQAPPDEPAERLIDNHLLFAEKAEAPGFDAAAFRRGLDLLEVADVLLAHEDSPQLVFESLNSKGLALTTADRVRNLVVASTFGDEQERLYLRRWLPLEERAQTAEEGATMTGILHAWLAQRCRSVRIYDEGDVYGLFKARLRDEFGGSLDDALASVADYCERYLSDEGFRAQADETAAEWVAGKPESSVSEYKLFGD